MRSSGGIKWAGRSVFIGATLADEPVGIAETTDGDWLVRDARIDRGIIDPNRHRLTPHPLRRLDPVALSMESFAARKLKKPDLLHPMYATFLDALDRGGLGHEHQ